jgi:hypothetical protein
MLSAGILYTTYRRPFSVPDIFAGAALGATANRNICTGI